MSPCHADIILQYFYDSWYDIPCSFLILQSDSQCQMSLIYVWSLPYLLEATTNHT